MSNSGNAHDERAGQGSVVGYTTSLVSSRDLDCEVRISR